MDAFFPSGKTWHIMLIAWSVQIVFSQLKIKHESLCLLVQVTPHKGFPGGSDGKESACNAGDLGSIPGSGRSPGEETVNHSTILAWRILCTEKPGRLQSIGSQRVRHDWVTNIHTLPIIPFLHINNLGNIFYTFLPGYGRVCVLFFFFPSRITIIILLKYQNLINSLILYQVPAIRHRPGNVGTQINES